jgi:hypothetical protein
MSNETADAEISNLEGEIILKTKVENNSTLDLSDARKGIYLIKLIIDDDILIKKVCLE